jgi:cytochrome b6-f complex iron-sulfur subunit
MTTEQISRNEFLKNIGFKGAALVALYCAGTSCKSTATVVPAQGDITIDLSSATYASLKTNGGYAIIKANDIIVARTLQGNIVAATLICSHEDLKKMTYKSGEFFCTEHSARFDNTGNGLNSEAKKGLKIYTTVLNGNMLTINA